MRASGVCLMDGAMGTELHRAGLGQDDCAELWNLTHPEKVRAVHRAYVDAGAEVIVANTFQANPSALRKFGAQDRLRAISRAAIALARAAAGPDRFVLASIGPADGCDVASARVIVEALDGADGLLVETQSDATLAEVVLRASREVPSASLLPVLISFTFLHPASGCLATWKGLDAESCARAVASYPIAALGVNCGRDIGMQEIADILAGYRRATALPLFARPNAGTPGRQDGQCVFPHGPDVMARCLPALRAAGATMIGGCCGTTPGHIRAFGTAIARAQNAMAPGRKMTV